MGDEAIDGYTAECVGAGDRGMSSVRQRISVVTPSLNQGRFLPSCIRSVVDQAYADLEYLVVDGGSTDDSIATIKAHEASIAWWVSEPDAGQYDALNKGFARATGDILAWLNADDVYLPWAFAVVAQVFKTLPEVEWISTVRPWATGVLRPPWWLQR
jgi:glycosyltransferase involved in cell wall biosynthesis